MEIRKTATKSYTVVNAMPNFCIFDDSFKITRLKYHSDKSMECFKCDKPFQVGDSVNIFIVKGHGNKIVCTSCYKEFKNHVRTP